MLAKVTLSVVVFFSIPVHAEWMRGQLYQKDKENAELELDFESKTMVEDGVAKMKSWYTYPVKDLNEKPSVAVIEDVSYNSDGSLKKYVVSQFQYKETWMIEVKGSGKERKIHFAKIKHPKMDDGELTEEVVEREQEDYVDNFVVGPTLLASIQKNWDQVLNGETVKIRFGVPDRKDTVGFKYFKDDEITEEEKKKIILKFKPSSFFIAALVDPVYITLSADGKKLFKIVGRTLPNRRRKDGSFKVFDARTTFTYLSEDPEEETPKVAPRLTMEELNRLPTQLSSLAKNREKGATLGGKSQLSGRQTAVSKSASTEAAMVDSDGKDLKTKESSEEAPNNVIHRGF